MGQKEKVTCHVLQLWSQRIQWELHRQQGPESHPKQRQAGQGGDEDINMLPQLQVAPEKGLICSSLVDSTAGNGVWASEAQWYPGAWWHSLTMTA